MNEIGARIYALRQEKRWSQDKLAQKSGLSRVYINSLEKGKRNPTLVTLIALATGLEISVEELVKGLGLEERDKA